MSLSVFLAWANIGVGLLLIIAISRLDILWGQRKYATETMYALILAGTLFIIGDISRLDSVTLSLYLLATITLCFLAVRMRYGRLPDDHLRRSTFASSVGAFIVFLLLLSLQLYGNIVSPYAVIVGCLIAALSLAFFFALQATWGLRHYTDRRKIPAGYGANPPTVTLAIPARNETHALTYCLEAALASNYPRLEILVLDDCSYDKTSELIRSFAHAGVRFIQGEVPSTGWLGKNNAYQTLLEQSTGKYIFFMGVDTNLQPSTITHIVSYAEKEVLNMVSILPRQQNEYLFPLVMQNLRYIWEIVLPLDPRRTPASSESWLVNRQALSDMGGFENFKQDVMPEKALASYFASKSRYRFIIADDMVPISYGKKWSSQIETATRLWYPACGRQPFTAIILSMLMLVLGIGPFIALLSGDAYITLLAAVCCLLYLLTYAAILYRLQPRTWWLSAWLLPVVIIQEALLVLISMAKYEFSTVDWKGRNICYPVLGVAEHHNDHTTQGVGLNSFKRPRNSL